MVFFLFKLFMAGLHAVTQVTDLMVHHLKLLLFNGPDKWGNLS